MLAGHRACAFDPTDLLKREASPGPVFANVTTGT
jgi:hypothetical protein